LHQKGPFAKYGSNLVAACAESGTDYVGITGEISWAGEMRLAHGEAAKKSGARIISFCGFDSMEIEQGTTWHVIEGCANGGTIQTALITESDTIRCFQQPVPFCVDDPLLLTHPRKRFDPNLQSRKNAMAKAEWFNLLISFDPIMMLGVSVPFFMAFLRSLGSNEMLSIESDTGTSRSSCTLEHASR
jgi:hypothetical protein